MDFSTVFSTMDMDQLKKSRRVDTTGQSAISKIV